MRNARVKASSTDKLRFEVHASTRSGEGAPEKWYMKAQHAVEVTRWVQSLQRAIEWSQRGGRGNDSDAASIASVRTDAGAMQTAPSPKKRFSRVTKNAVFGSIKRSGSSQRGSSASSLHREPLPVTAAPDHYSSDEDNSTKASSQDRPPHHDSFELLGNTATTHIELAAQLVTSLDAVEASSVNADETRASIKTTISQAQSMLVEYTRMVQEREAWFKAKLAREQERAGIWEESLQKVVQEGEELEEELKRTIKQNKQQRRRSKVFQDADQDGTVRQNPVRRLSLVHSNDVAIPPALSPVSEKSPMLMISAQVSSQPQSPASPAHNRAVASRVSNYSEDSDSDEFFDAIEANALPNLVVSEPLKTNSVIKTNDDWINASLFEGYAHPRERLDLGADNRPPVSLWAVLKGAIGKDLTVSWIFGTSWLDIELCGLAHQFSSVL